MQDKNDCFKTTKYKTQKHTQSKNYIQMQIFLYSCGNLQKMICIFYFHVSSFNKNVWRSNIAHSVTVLKIDDNMWNIAFKFFQTEKYSSMRSVCEIEGNVKEFLLKQRHIVLDSTKKFLMQLFYCNAFHVKYTSSTMQY